MFNTYRPFFDTGPRTGCTETDQPQHGTSERGRAQRPHYKMVVPMPKDPAAASTMMSILNTSAQT